MKKEEGLRFERRKFLHYGAVGAIALINYYDTIRSKEMPFNLIQANLLFRNGYL